MGTSNYLLPLKPNTYHDINIDWGDGTSEIYTGTPGYGSGGNSVDPLPFQLTHTYPASAVYNIKISPRIPNGFPGFYQYGYNTQNWTYLRNHKNILRINNFGNSTSRWTNLSYAFSNCKRLSSMPEIPYDVLINVRDMAGAFTLCTSLSSFTFINTRNITNFNGTWAFCSSLTSFPLLDTSNAILLGSSSGNPWGTGGSGAWLGCTSLSSFPLINTSKVTTFSNAWRGCTSLTSFPPIDTSSVGSGRDFFAVWNGCSNLKSFPWINTSNVGAFGNGNQGTVGTWTNCSSLTSFPEIDTSKAAAFYFTWSGCTSLSSFPKINVAGLSGAGGSGTNIGGLWGTWYNCNNLITFSGLENMSSCTWLNNTWGFCSKLTAFPMMDTSNVTTFDSVWSGCKDLSASDFPTLNMSKMIDGTNCFQGVKLTTNSYSTLLSSICATNTNNSVTFHGGNSLYNSTFGLSARNYLVNTKGWTITDGGVGISTVLELNDGSGNLTQEDNSLITINT
jgi:hypothetical protein